MEKIKVDENFGDFTYCFDGPIESVIKDLQAKKSFYEEKGYTNLRLDYNSHYDETSIDLWGTRDETDAEFKKRTATVKKVKKEKSEARKKIEEEERKTYERLRKKFEK